jgi:hypothetical protein
MSRDEAMLGEIKQLVANEIPGFSVEVKEKSGIMRTAAAAVWLFNRDFLTRYVTTWYPKVFVPAQLVTEPAEVWPVLCHELVHLKKARKSRLVHAVSYLFPACFAPLALLSIAAAGGDLWWLLNLCWLLFLLPLPAYFRMLEELEGYRMDLAVEYWTTGGVTNFTITRVAGQFTGPAYYYMWPFTQAIRRTLYHEVAEIRKGVYDSVPPYKQVKELIDRVWKTTP